MGFEPFLSRETYGYSSRTPNKEDYARVALLKLALYCGVSHSDPNKDNILINNNNHILLIDFGSIIKEHDKDVITEEEKTQIINNLKEHKYSDALKLCNKFYTPPIFIPPYDPIEPEIAWVHKGKDIIMSKPNPIIDSFCYKRIY
jgi:serine/threonine protein kinase